MFTKKKVFEDFISFLDCYRNNYSNIGRKFEPKIIDENRISKLVLNILY